VALVVALGTALELVRPIAHDHGVELTCEDPEESVPPVMVHPVALRQILLSLLGMAVRRAHQGQVHCFVTATGDAVRVTVQALTEEPMFPPEDEAAQVDVLRRVLRVCGGQLELSSTPASLVVTVTLPAHERVPVLVIDDNADTLALIRRYLAGTRYAFLGARALAEALPVAQQEAPSLIVLDVMMPEMDGWEVLGRLRAHPLTQDAHIIICTILAEEELALSLGASAFVHKPINREDLLQALDRQWALQRPASR
jgi:CheY-like chemotaxis protein